MNKKHLKTLMIQECAKVMYFEGVSQYFDAKRIAAKRVCKNKHQYFPSNAEVSEAVHALSLLDESFDRDTVLFRMRLKALELMDLLSCFSPRLIGSVSTGKIKSTSDIDLHVFCDHIETLLVFLSDQEIQFEQNEVLIMKNNKPKLYQHIYFTNEFDIELSVYAESEIRVTSKSSTDGKPIVRLTKAKLERLIQKEHWRQLVKKGN